MSLEARLESLEKSVDKLTAIIEKSLQSAANAATSPPDQSGGSAAASSKPARRGRKPAAEKKEAEPKKEESAEDKLENTLKPLVLKTVEKAGKDATVAVLAEFGAKRASDLTPDQYDEAIGALKDAIKAAEVPDDLAA